MATPSHAPDSKPDIEEQHPLALLIGLFLGFASVIFLTFGFLWPLAPLFPAVVAARPRCFRSRITGTSRVVRSMHAWGLWRSKPYSCRSSCSARRRRLGRRAV